MENQNPNQNNNSMDEVKSDTPVFPASSAVSASNELGQPIQASSEIQIPNDDLHVELARQAALSADLSAKASAAAEVSTKAEANSAKDESKEEIITELEKNIEENIIPSSTKASDGRPEENLGVGKTAVITKILEQIMGEIEQIKKLIATPEGAEVKGELMVVPAAIPQEIATTSSESNVVEGVFDGEAMIGSDGKKYDVPPNYASKSKLVEGDILKLTITAEGSFLFKQIGPIERNRIVGMLTYEPVTGRYIVAADGKKWFVLTASVTYFRGKPGDEAVILVPKNAPSQWAAVENIIGRKSFGSGFHS
jgi:hypothetical protein